MTNNNSDTNTLHTLAERYFLDTYDAQPQQAKEILGVHSDITTINEMKIAMHHLSETQARLKMCIDLAKQRVVNAYLSITEHAPL